MQISKATLSYLTCDALPLNLDALPQPLEERISCMIKKANLTGDTNSFFILAKETRKISLGPALMIALSWREITKKFMFTVIAGLGVLAEKISELDNPPENILHALQIGIAIIADDLNNVSTIFKEIAPQGEAGIHYRWWEDSMLNPLLKAAKINHLSYKTDKASKTDILLKNMTTLSKTPLGAVIQLRVVEAIALDIMTAFSYLFRSLEIEGKKFFNYKDALALIHSHIKAEVFHCQQVTDKDSSIINIFSSLREQEQLLLLAYDYINCWSDVFMEYKSFLCGNEC